MSRIISPVTGKPYGLAAVCRVWRLARRAFIATGRRRRWRSGAGRSARCRMMR
jgi:hypothetical protein